MSHPMLVDVGRRVRALRDELGLTQRELAERAGLSLRFVAQLEHGAANISLTRFADVATALGRGPAELLQATPAQRPILALLGVRGAGKSSVGARVARALSVPFVELDALVARAAGLSLAEVFELHGEDYYRRLQRDTLRRFLSETPAAVLATGGSIVNDREAFDLLKQHATTIWLRARPKDHWERVVKQGDRRPMAENPHAYAELGALLRARAPLYATAHHVIDTVALDLPRTAAAVLQAVR